MLLAEVEYARPKTVEEAVGLLSAHEGARGLPGGQTLGDGMTGGAAGTDIVTAAASLNGGARIAIGCVDAVPVRATQMEERIGSDFSDGNMRAAAEGLGATLDPPSDLHASADSP